MNNTTDVSFVLFRVIPLQYLTLHFHLLVSGEFSIYRYTHISDVA